MAVRPNRTLSPIMAKPHRLRLLVAILIDFVSITDVLEQHCGVFWTQRQAAQDLGDLQVALDLRRAFHVEPSDQALDVDDSGRLAIEGKDDEIALKGRMGAHFIRQDLHLHIRQTARREETIQLFTYNPRAANRPVHYRLIKKHFDLWRILPGQEFLPGGSFLDSLFDFFGAKLRNSFLVYAAGVVANLEQPRDDRRMVDRHRRRLLLKPDKGLVGQ